MGLQAGRWELGRLTQFGLVFVKKVDEKMGCSKSISSSSVCLDETGHLKEARGPWLPPPRLWNEGLRGGRGVVAGCDFLVSWRWLSWAHPV